MEANSSTQPLSIRSVSTAVVEANFDWTLIRLETEDGQIGWGESFFAPGLTAIVRELGRLMTGRDARHIGALMHRLRRAASGAGSNGGIVVNALSGIDAALWDLNARALDVPLWRLLGGRLHERVRLYADCHSHTGLTSLGPLLDLRAPAWTGESAAAAGAPRTFFDLESGGEPVDLAALRDRAAAMVAAGFDALKFDVDVPGLLPRQAGSGHLRSADAGLLTAMLDAIRDGTGPGVDVALDCHWRYDLPSAQRIADACHGHDVLWLEDPLSVENEDGLVELSRRTSVPLGGGENLCGWAGFARLVETRALAIVTPDLGKLGGVDEARTLGQLSTAAGLSIAPHNIAGPVGTAFAAQVSSTFPNLLMLEFHASDVPFFNELIDRPLVTAGSVDIGDRPGIGIDVDVEQVRRWSKPGEPVFGDAVATVGRRL